MTSDDTFIRQMVKLGLDAYETKLGHPATSKEVYRADGKLFAYAEALRAAGLMHHLDFLTLAIYEAMARHPRPWQKGCTALDLERWRTELEDYVVNRITKGVAVRHLFDPLVLANPMTCKHCSRGRYHENHRKTDKGD